jgi:hypothetical protein
MSSVEKRPGRDPGARDAGRRKDTDEFWSDIGVDIESMSPQAQVTTAMTVLALVLAGAVLVFSQIPGFWWLIFVFGWLIFPALGLLVRGIAGLSEGATELPATNGKERELLEALRKRGELSPAQAAMETSLTVAEADGMLKELVEGGHLDVRVRGGGLFYSLWDRDVEIGEGS